jgi:beta-lactamase class A
MLRPYICPKGDPMRTRSFVSIIFSFLCVLSFLCLLCLPLAAQDGDPRIGELRAKHRRDLEKTAAEFDGAMGIAVKDLTSSQTFFVNADTVFPQASSIKIPILLELLRQAQAGKLKLEERVELRRATMTGGSGVLLRFGDGTSALSLRDLATLMIVLSDNTATNILIDRVGMDNVNGLLRELGLKDTKLQRRMMDIEAGRASRENLSTPREMATLLELLHKGKILDAAHTALAIEILKYPKSTSLRRGVPPQVEVANKPGGIPGVACDSGIVLLAGRPYAISVMTTYGRDEEAAGRAITEASRSVFAYFERLARSNLYGARTQ